MNFENKNLEKFNKHKQNSNVLYKRYALFQKKKINRTKLSENNNKILEKIEIKNKIMY